MHFIVIMLLIGGGSWLWLQESPKYKVLAAILVALGVIALLGLGLFYFGLHRDQKK